MAGKPKCDDQVLEAIEKHWRVFGLPPAIDFVVENSCLESKSTVWGAFRRLKKDWKIYLIKGKAIPVELRRHIMSYFKESR
jgi:hypothetical protein